MSARLRAIATETESIVEAGLYRTPEGREISIERTLAAALSGTRLYGPDPVPVAALDTDRASVIEVTDESSLQAARRMTGEGSGRIAVLNYASARNPGVATSTARRPRRRPCAAAPRCTPPCCGPPTTTPTTGPNAAPSTPIG